MAKKAAIYVRVSGLNCAPGKGILKVAREVGVGTGTVQRRSVIAP